MDLGFAYLLGVLLGQWVMFIINCRALTRLIKALAEESQRGSSSRTMVIDLVDDPMEFPKY